MRSVEDEFSDISSRSWCRAVEGIAKNGFREGATDGRASTFQDSFDVGYKEGLDYGINVGFHRALHRVHLNVQDIDLIQMDDPQKVNCLICQDSVLLKQHVTNVDKIQKEKNLNKISEIKEKFKLIVEELNINVSKIINS